MLQICDCVKGWLVSIYSPNDGPLLLPCPLFLQYSLQFSLITSFFLLDKIKKHQRIVNPVCPGIPAAKCLVRCQFALNFLFQLYMKNISYYLCAHIVVREYKWVGGQLRLFQLELGIRILLTDFTIYSFFILDRGRNQYVRGSLVPSRIQDRELKKKGQGNEGYDLVITSITKRARKW